MGMGLAFVVVVKGYKCIFIIIDKQLKEKIDFFCVVGGEVIVCFINVEADDFCFYYSVVCCLSMEIFNSYWCNQYDNLFNCIVYYESIGFEIWKQIDGKIIYMIVGVGIGGIIFGIGCYFKE